MDRGKRCVRCIKKTKATTIERVVYQGVTSELELCDPHADALYRDMWAWLRVAREITNPSGQWEPPRQVQRSVEPVKFRKSEPAVKPAEPAKKLVMPATARNWSLAKHAEERLELRGGAFDFTRDDVLLAAERPELVLPNPNAKGTEYRSRGKVLLVVDPTRRKIITVLVNAPGGAFIVEEELDGSEKVGA